MELDMGIGLSGELKRSNHTSSLFTETREVIDRHTVLRSQLEKAAELAGSVVIEQRPPLCRILLPLHRLFQEFSAELESYLELEENTLFPDLLASFGSRLPAGDVIETVRLLKHGQEALSRVLSEICDLTQGFQAPDGVCLCYAELLDVLRAIQTELLLKFHREREMLFPQAMACVEALIM